MAKLLQFGLVFPNEMASGIGHVACTLGGINYESRGGAGCLKGEGFGPAGHGFGRQISISTLLADISAGRSSDDIVAIQKALNREVGADLMGTGFYGPRTTAFYSEWQRKLGFVGSVELIGSNADGTPGTESLEKLGFMVVA